MALHPLVNLSRAAGHRPSGGSLRLFLRHAVHDRARVGAIAPSSSALAQELGALLEPRVDRAVRVLEVGAGTGAVTCALLQKLSAGSRLDAVEVNADFAAALQAGVRRLSSDPGDRDLPEVHVHAADVRDLPAEGQYDHIVSGLPFTNFTPTAVEQILERYSAMLRPGGTISYFAYRGTGTMRRITSSPAEARRHRAAEAVLRTYRDRHHCAGVTVWRNLPPAQVWHLTDRRELR